jgi:hypothetical protein
MGLRWPDYRPQSKNDVAFVALSDPRHPDPRADDKLRSIIDSPARIFVNGRAEDLPEAVSPRRFADFIGGADPHSGLYRIGDLAPLATLRPFEQIVRGWAATGEMITACIRAGRMPTVWMSVWLEGAFARNGSFVEHNNLREPWFTPLFHKDRYIPPLPPGYAARAFLDFIEAIRKALASQSRKLAQAGRWMAQAKRHGKRVFVVAVGHSYPMILSPDNSKDYPLEWGRSNSDLRTALPDDLGAGDVALHLGYAPTQPGDVSRWLKRGLRLVHTSPYGRTAGIKDHKNLIWLDLPWRPGDACVDIPGYGARILPSSSAAHTMAYFAILCEMAHCMGWR